MTLRRYAPLALALAALGVGCQPKIDSRENPASIDFVAFDLSREIDGVNTIIPQPSDVSLANAALLPASAQRELLEKFIAAGGFPWEQEVAITIDFSRQLIGEEADKKIFTATTVDTSTVTGSTVAVFQYATGGVPGTPTLVPFDAAATTFTAGNGRGTLTLHRPKDAVTGSRAWTPNAQYVVFVRGGASGVKVTGGGEINAWPTMRVILNAAIAGRPLTDPANQGLLPGTAQEKADAAARLEPLRQGFAQLLPISAALGWAPEEIVSMQTFDVAPAAGTVVVVDSGSGIAPLPIDLARDPATGLIAFNTAFGPAAAGLATLDGFSTTAMVLSTTSGPIDAATVTAANVKLFKLGGATPELVVDLAGALGGGTPALARYVTQPSNLNQACGIPSGSCTTAIGLQPAVPAPVPAVGTFFMPPLQEDTSYAVVITNGVKDVAGNGLIRPTVGKILLDLTAPLVANGTSLLGGVPNSTAQALENMRAELAPLFSGGTPLVDKASVALAYTFKTQTVTATSVAVTTAPYSFEQAAGAAIFNPAAVTAITPAEMETITGYPAGSFPDVASFYTTTITTPNGLDLASGALARPQTAWLTPGNTVNVLVTAPFEPQVTAQLAPLVVFHHGITRMKEDVLAIANLLAARGFVVAAIDAPYHGSRAVCSANPDCDDLGADGVCTPVAGTTFGTCTTGTPRPSVSGNQFVSSNFFRTRDAIRQDLMDQSALVLALARPPAPTWPQPAANALTTALAGLGVGYAIDPARVYFVGQSLGGIIGAEMLATNPRFGRGVLNVAGGTLTDIFTTAPDFQAEVDALFLSLGIDRSLIPTVPAVAAAYLKTVNVAKWILDPADPINYAAYVETGLASQLDQLAVNLGVTSTQAFGMAAQGDTTVPNPYNFELYGLAPGLEQVTYVGNGSVDGALLNVPHGFLLNGTSLNATLAAQADAADFLETLAFPVDDLPGTTTPGFQVILP